MAQDSMQPFLPDDHTTVGFESCVKHRPGSGFTVSTELIEPDGPKLLFRVEAVTRTK